MCTQFRVLTEISGLTCSGNEYISVISFFKRGPGSSVGIATGYRL